MKNWQCLPTGILLCALAGFCILSSCETARAQESMVSVRLRVAEPAGVARYAEPVTTGIPFPRGVVKDLAGLRLVDGKGQMLAAQFRAHARWPRGSPRWVLVDFQTDLKPGGRARFKIVQADKRAPTTALQLDETADEIRVDTGKISFSVSKKRGTLVEALTVGAEAVLTPDKPAGVLVRDAKGKEFRSNLARPDVVRIEEKGPMRVTVLVEGGFRSQAGDALFSGLARYSARIHAYAGKDYLKLSLALINDGAFGYGGEPVEWLFFDALVLELPVNLAGPVELASHDLKRTFSSDQSWRVYQYHRLKSRYREPDNFFYRVKLDGETVSRGKRNAGWFDLRTSRLGLALALRDFWQNYPKAVSFDRGVLRVELWPREGYYPDDTEARQAGTYTFAGGRQKTHEMLLRFYHPEEASPAGRELAAIINMPLMALARRSWYADTDTLGLIAPAGLRTSELSVKEAVSRFEKHQLGLVVLEQSERGSTIYTARESRDHAVDWYGWMNFGGMYWDRGISSLHYDWPYSMLLHYLRTGKRRFFDMGSEMARHRYDIDQYHSPRAALAYKYLQRSDWGDANTHGAPRRAVPTSSERLLPAPARTWVKGLALYYLLTGDMHAWESCKQVGEGLRGRWFALEKIHQRPKSVELAATAWTLENWLTLYEVTAARRYLRWSKILFENCLLHMDEQSGKTGYFARHEQFPVVVGALVEPLVKYHRHTRDKRCLDLLERMMEWSARALAGGGMLAGKYVPLAYPYLWQEGNKGIGSLAVTYDTFYANGFAYLYLHTGKKEYLELARKVFRDSVYYWDLTPPVDPGARSQTGYYSPKYPGSLTKVHGRLSRYHQVYLFMERHLGAGGQVPLQSWHILGEKK